MINVNVYLAQSLIHDELILKDKNVIVIDALRATSTIHTALENSAKEVIPTENIMVAARVSKGLGNSLLCGERNGKIIEGFNLGNSPFEYPENVVKGKSLIFSTTNGALAIVKSKFAKNSILASFLNLSAVVDYIIELNQDITIICSGKLNDYCIEDSLVAGLIIWKLIQLKDKNFVSLKDSGYSCYQLAKNLAVKSGSIDTVKLLCQLKKTEHGKFLISLGFEEDIVYCSDLDKYKTIPVFKNNIIKLKDKFETEAAEKSKMKRVNISNKLSPKIEPKKQK